MLITQEEMNRRLNSERNLINRLKIEPRVNTPQVKGDNLRSIAGALARQDKPSNVARAFDMTMQQVHSASHSQKPEVAEKVQASVDRVQELALTRLMESLNLLTPDKIENEKPRDIARIAVEMSRIVEKTSPRETSTQLQLVVYAPGTRPLSDYPVIDV